MHYTLKLYGTTMLITNEEIKKTVIAHVEYNNKDLTGFAVDELVTKRTNVLIDHVEKGYLISYYLCMQDENNAMRNELDKYYAMKKQYEIDWTLAPAGSLYASIEYVFHKEKPTASNVMSVHERPLLQVNKRYTSILGELSRTTINCKLLSVDHVSGAKEYTKVAVVEFEEDDAGKHRICTFTVDKFLKNFTLAD